MSLLHEYDQQGVYARSMSPKTAQAVSPTSERIPTLSPSTRAILQASSSSLMDNSPSLDSEDNSSDSRDRDDHDKYSRVYHGFRRSKTLMTPTTGEPRDDVDMVVKRSPNTATPTKTPTNTSTTKTTTSTPNTSTPNSSTPNSSTPNYMGDLDNESDSKLSTSPRLQGAYKAETDHGSLRSPKASPTNYILSPERSLDPRSPSNINTTNTPKRINTDNLAQIDGLIGTPIDNNPVGTPINNPEPSQTPSSVYNEPTPVKPLKVKRQFKLQEVPPSHPDFDRTGLSDHEYIELLLFENRELQAVVEKQNVELEDYKKSASPHDDMVSVSPLVSPSSIEVPIRSARRKEEPKQIGDLSRLVQEREGERDIREVGEGERDVREVGEVREVREDKQEGQTREDLEIARERQEGHRHDQEGHRHDQERQEGHRHDQRQTREQTEQRHFEPERVSVVEPLRINKLDLDTDRKTTEAETDQPRHPDTSVNDTHDSIEQQAVLERVVSARSNTSTEIRPVRSHENKLGISNKNASSSSFSSYKSRIRLPHTLSQQSIPGAQGGTQGQSQGPTQGQSQGQPQGQTQGPQGIPQSQSLGQMPSQSQQIQGGHIPQSQSQGQIQGQGQIHGETPQTAPPQSSLPSLPHSQNMQNLHPYVSDAQLLSPVVVQQPYNTPPTQITPAFGDQKHKRVSPTSRSERSFGDESVQTPVSSTFQDGRQHPGNTPSSSYRVLSTPRVEEHDSLFIKPEDFNTIEISVSSTIHVSNTAGRRSDDPNFTLAIADRASRKELWRIRKTYSQFVAFDGEIRPVIEYFGLPPTPDRQLFFSTAPNKIETRRCALHNYFTSIFLMPHIPHMILYKICKFLSLDFVNPMDDFRSGAEKEGYLVRRYKALGTSWKVRWCQVDSQYLQVFENPGGPLLEQISLSGAQIGRQSSDTVAEDRGYRHAFLLVEALKSSKLSSSYPKHFFCAETDQERDEWVDVLLGQQHSNDSASTIDGYEPSEKYHEPSHRNTIDSHDPPPAYGGPPGSYSSLPKYNDPPQKGPREVQSIQAPVQSEEPKRSKKRSLFPFRNKQPEEGKPEPAPPNKMQMQQYLDQMNLDETMSKQIFGRELAEAFSLSRHRFQNNRELPSIFFRCIDYLKRTGAVYEEGIFRLSGSAMTIRQLKEEFNTNFDLDLFESPLKPDIHTVAGLFKTYLRELPSPLLGSHTYNHLNHVVLQNESLSPSVLATVFRDYISEQVDDIHYDACYVLFSFLREVIAHSANNRMNLRNVCIVFVPTLNISLEVLTTLLVDFECIFEGGQPVGDNEREVLDLKIPGF